MKHTTDNKDWTGNANSVMRMLGASNHTTRERASRDYYATDPKAAVELLRFADIDPNSKIWEPACGGGHLAQPLIDAGYSVILSDIEPQCDGAETLDFLFCEPKDCDVIITNPPFIKSFEFAQRALLLLPKGGRLFLFLRIQWLEGYKRWLFFQNNPPKKVWVAVKRIPCGRNGIFGKDFSHSTVTYAWFEWEKGWKGETTLGWFNYD